MRKYLLLLLCGLLLFCSCQGDPSFDGMPGSDAGSGDIETRAVKVTGKLEGTLMTGVEARLKIMTDGSFVIPPRLWNTVNIRDVQEIEEDYFAFTPIAEGTVELEFSYLYNSGLQTKNGTYTYRGTARANPFSITGAENTGVGVYSALTLTHTNDGRYSYEWDIPATVVYTLSADKRTANIKYPAEGTYTIRARSVNISNGEAGHWASITVRAHGLPGSDPVLREGISMPNDWSSRQIDLIIWDIPNREAYNYNWTIDGGLSPVLLPDGKINITPTTANSYDFSLRVTGKYSDYDSGILRGHLTVHEFIPPPGKERIVGHIQNKTGRQMSCLFAVDGFAHTYGIQPYQTIDFMAVVDTGLNNLYMSCDNFSGPQNDTFETPIHLGANGGADIDIQLSLQGFFYVQYNNFGESYDANPDLDFVSWDYGMPRP